MFCSNCGKKLPDNAKFCTQCGKQIASNTVVEAAAPIKPEPEPVEVVVEKKLDPKPVEEVIKAPATPPGIVAVQCPHCGQHIEYYRSDVRPHRNYPNGFVYCPNCSRPIGYSLLYCDTFVDTVFTTTCNHCHNVVTYQLRDVRPHNRWPYGYFICPVCKKPVGHHRDNAVRK